MQGESQRRYLFVAIDRATRWVFVQLKSNKTAASSHAFLKALHKACPLRITKLLTDNGKEFTDRLFASKEREPSGNHEFDQLCRELGIEHRLTKPRTPRTNGMVERFNGRIADVLKTHRFNSREDMEQTLLRYVACTTTSCRSQRGARQATCRLGHAANGGISSRREAAATTESRSGLSVTVVMCVQSRVWPDQRAGLRSRAWR